MALESLQTSRVPEKPFSRASRQQTLRELYQSILILSRQDISVRQVFDLWDIMVTICDSYIALFGEGADPEMIELRRRSIDKREFHRCGW